MDVLEIDQYKYRLTVTFKNTLETGEISCIIREKGKIQSPSMVDRILGKK